ncbi:NAD(P)H-dependent oxidoreductase subunit E, partial [bacterium]|nr:NAD(P)H-dependent oxidoreductase subunit E [bacterium]
MPSSQPDIAFSEDRLAEAKRIIAQYPEGRQKSAILPILHMAQHDFGGWLSVPVMDYVAQLLSIQPVEVYEVATFYTMFHLKPTGKYVLEVCRTGPCWLAGSEQIVQYMETVLGIKEGETTPDGLFTI